MVSYNNATQQIEEKTTKALAWNRTNTRRQGVHPYPTMPRIVIWQLTRPHLWQERGESKHVINRYLLETFRPLILILIDTAAKADQWVLQCEGQGDTLLHWERWTEQRGKRETLVTDSIWLGRCKQHLLIFQSTTRLGFTQTYTHTLHHLS